MLSSLGTYEFRAPRIVFGWGRREEIGAWATRLGKRALLVYGSRTLEANGTYRAIRENLSAAGVTTRDVASIAHEPLVSDVDAAVSAIRTEGVREATL